MGWLWDNFSLFLLVMVRVWGVLATSPVFGARFLPASVRASLVLFLSVFLTPLVPRPTMPVTDLFPYFFFLIRELALGLAMGYTANLLFVGLQLAGQILDTEMGFGITNVIDPLFGQPVPLVGNFQYLIGLLIFLGINGHHLILSALAESFQALPPAGWYFTDGLVSFLVDLVGEVFLVAVQLALPAAGGLFLTTVALGLLSRAVPQMNVFVVGLPLKIIVGSVLLAVTLPLYTHVLGIMLEGLAGHLERFLLLIGR
ncbi:MAG: flagellar type III secretion system protein FliR [Firmicutes bacterium]|nr:flagellar type III secretion system protein FliR [Bacillota bacterium]MCL5039510.1 flagellar type III secretion system protein FliR [Bacillota bacterium]